MNLLKICALILFYFLSRVAMANPCETFKALNSEVTLCWSEKLMGWVSKDCFDPKKTCEALKFFETAAKISDVSENTDGQNPSAKLCKELDLTVDIYRDSQNNEQSMCVFGDLSMVDSHTLRRHVR